MGVINTIKNWFTRGKGIMNPIKSILDHERVAVSKEEYARIQENLRYYESRDNRVNYTNTEYQIRERDFKHLPIARTACKKIAGIIYNEQAEVKIDDEVANEFINETLKRDRFNKNFERYLESALALGGMAMRPYLDGERIRVAFIQAPVFFPSQTNTQDISSAVIAMKSTKADRNNIRYYTLLEIHEWLPDGKYKISNELYRSDIKDNLGNQVPLSELYDDLEESTVFTGLSRPLFTYLRTPGMNNKDINSSLGLSIFDNAKTTIDFINTTYDEFAWEIKMGQRRVAVPAQTVRTYYDQRGDKVVMRQHFDPDQNVFVQLDSGADDKSVGVHDLTTEIRSESYIAAINQGLKLFEMQIGVSSGMFTFDGKSMKTATEVVSENSDTYQMRNSIVSLVEHSMSELIVSICELAKATGLYTGEIPTLDEITINLDDGIFADKNAELDYWSKALAAGLVPKRYAIEKALGMTEEQAQVLADEVEEETARAMNRNRSQFDIDVYGE